jgi:predicted ATPase
MVRSGLIEKGLGLMNKGLELWDGSGARIWSPYTKSILAEANALSGDLDKGIGLVDTMLEQVERPGWDERSHLAEVLRLKGWMLSLKGDLAGAEQNYLASLDWARQQQAKSWELRTSTSLARLWQGQGKRKDAHELLAPVYNWFTEGFDTKDLRDANELLGELR